jgi:CxxC motif-containing protein (DUF1111 family)
MPIKQPDRAKLAEIHPALLTQGSFPLHRFSTEKEHDTWKTDKFPHLARNTFAGTDIRLFESSKIIDGVNIALIPSQRRPPALFGAGFIDRIPDRVLEEVAGEQQQAAAASLARIQGRVSHLKDGRVGRFGWKSHVATLREFTLQACSNELGLEVPGFHRAAPPWKKNYQAPGIDLTAEQCDRLIQFVASLPAPVIRAAETPQHATEIAAGQTLFTKAGCAVCHRPTLGDVKGIYSDLLLHDMGQSLSDTGSYGVIDAEIANGSETKPLPVSGDEQAATKQKPPKFGAASREWRTPPLWAFRDSGPYLHDGRADTVAEAVRLHDGEGLAAAQAFSRLTARERMQVEMFLQSLVAPPPAG